MRVFRGAVHGDICVFLQKCEYSVKKYLKTTNYLKKYFTFLNFFATMKM